ncbi:selenocysteine-specific translation elongation factor [Sporomusa paucivorans]|uniref:selenocysteine-specific translation elongation factor n=1 Tax=Sporomusa paucivorans TaxID=2376 RepID=UPI0035716F8B
MKYVIIGTAGHVDHGKSAIIKALTGTETDRLKEEQMRGISIDLGFASLSLGDKLKAGIVDVPGHERFLKNMLAGTGGIDLAMLVIAADEGIMPQTKEHLAMLQLYGIRQGIIVINKIDKVDGEWLELVEEEIREYMKDTFLQAAAICRVSAITGEGFAGLKASLAELAEKIPARDSTAPFRLWIDRVFTVKGHGAVVTGSVLSGQAGVGDSLLLYPAETVVRIRGLESHGEKADNIIAGQRAAINLTGIEQEQLSRGMMLSASTRGEISCLWDVAADWRQEVENGLRVRLHLGTGEFLGRIYSFKGTDNRYMRLILEQPLAAGAGDRGIIRLYSPQHLLGGVTLIAPGRNTRRLTAARAALAAAVACSDEAASLYYRLAESRQLLTKEEIKRQSGYLPDRAVNQAIERLTAAEKIRKLDKSYIATVVLERLSHTVTGILQDYHRREPDRNGLSKEIVRQKMSLGEKNFDILLACWLETGVVVIDGGQLALKNHAERHGGWQQEVVAKAAVAFENIGLINIDPELLAQKIGLPPDKIKVAHGELVRAGVLIKLGDMFVYSKTIQNIVQLIHTYFQEKETLTVAELRDILNTSRKIAVPIMEYLDMNKYTIREGDIRRPSRKIMDFSE